MRARLSPSVHEHLLIGCDGLFFELCTAILVTHERSEVFLGVTVLKELFADWTKAGKLTQIVTRDGLHLIHASLVVHLRVGLVSQIWSVPQDIDERVDALQILCIVEVDKVGLPELFGMHG